MQQHSGQHLPYLIMKIAGDANPFGLLRSKDTAAALLSLAFEPVEHAVESPYHGADFIVPADIEPLAASKEIHRPHPMR